MTETDPSAIITDEMRAWIGRSAGPFAIPEQITATDIRRFLDATGDDNPLWTDDAYAQAAGYQARAVPPMLILELYRRASGTGEGDAALWHGFPWPDGYTDTRNAGNEVEWVAPVYLGDQLSVEHQLVDLVARQGRAGIGIYLTRESAFRNQAGEVVVRLRATTVKLRGQVGRADSAEGGHQASPSRRAPAPGWASERPGEGE